jgi:hypothetical protein
MGISKTSWKKGKKKTGGRKAGTPNRVTQAHRAFLAQMKVDRRDPLNFFLSILRNENAPFEEVKAAAKEALPYTNPKLASIEARTGGKTHEQPLAELEAMEQDSEHP